MNRVTAESSAKDAQLEEIRTAARLNSDEWKQLEAYLKQQIDAKDAQIAALTKERNDAIAACNDNGDKAEYWCNEAERAEADNRKLREALQTHAIRSNATEMWAVCSLCKATSDFNPELGTVELKHKPDCLLSPAAEGEKGAKK